MGGAGTTGYIGHFYESPMEMAAVSGRRRLALPFQPTGWGIVPGTPRWGGSGIRSRWRHWRELLAIWRLWRWRWNHRQRWLRRRRRCWLQLVTRHRPRRAAGNGGFGGGGGGGFSAASNGSGGFGGWRRGGGGGGGGHVGGGGGGLGAGGAIFVAQGGGLTIEGGSVSGGTVGGGAGGSGYAGTSSGSSGAGFGTGMFVEAGPVTLAPAAGTTLSFADGIADTQGSGGSGAASIIVNGAGTVLLSGSSSFTGGVTLAAGILVLDGASAAGSGAIRFAGAATLQLDSAALSGTAAASSFGTTISDFAAGDTIDLAGLSFNASAVATLIGTTLTMTENGQTVALTLPLGEDVGVGLSADAGGGTQLVGMAASALATATLTSGQDLVTGGAGNDIFLASAGALSTGDVIRGGGGINTLRLSGGGTFDGTAPGYISGIQHVQAFEAAGAGAQTVILRDGCSVTLDVASDISGDAGAGITIIGARDASVINLGSGNDSVTLGGNRETVNGGGGNDVFIVTAQSIGATINGGSLGSNTLDVAGGGTMNMGANISGIADVQLLTTTRLRANAISGLSINGSSAGGDVIVLGNATRASPRAAPTRPLWRRRARRTR